MKGLTSRQREILLFWGAFTYEHGYPPTIREAMPHLGIQFTNVLSEHLVLIERKGFVRRDAGQVRNTVVTAAGWRELGACSSRAKVVEVLAVMRCEACGAASFRFPCPMCRKAGPVALPQEVAR